MKSWVIWHVFSVMQRQGNVEAGICELVLLVIYAENSCIVLCIFIYVSGLSVLSATRVDTSVRKLSILLLKVSAFLRTLLSITLSKNLQPRYLSGRIFVEAYITINPILLTTSDIQPLLFKQCTFINKGWNCW